ncbi:MAG: TIGR02300 family protein [Alphaproteobacteria bacterium]|nr:TIGR02300 family protein [Alphaproteobacteria bacterium]
MAKPEWGTKRTCLSCGVRFYDLGKKPITCPSCESSFEPEAFVKTRRSRQSAPIEPKKVTEAAKVPEKEAEIAGTDTVEAAVANDDDKAPGDDSGEEDDAVLPVAADAEDESEDMAELVDKPGENKGNG